MSEDEDNSATLDAVGGIVVGTIIEPCPWVTLKVDEEEDAVRTT